MTLAENLTPELRPGIDTVALGTRRSGVSNSLRGMGCVHGRAARWYDDVVMVAPQCRLYAPAMLVDKGRRSASLRSLGDPC